ncbi:MAG: ABC transporter ATP-binding protein [Lachnospiraceae bacterium]|nr:ABC transporter ATP-binding protein [Lachnospiraceae bacterium]
MLELTDVTKAYRGKTVVDRVSFSVNGGETLGIVGANGAGKSTLAAMIVTLLKPDLGKIELDGLDVTKASREVRSRIGYVPQDIALYETLSGMDNLKFWAGANKVPKGMQPERIAKVCEIIRFDRELALRRVSTYSGGMKRRLNIGVALLHEPKLLVLDEPTTGIDMQSCDQILETVEELRKDGVAVVYIGHYIEEIERVATHLTVLAEGRVRYFGAKDGLPKGKTLSEFLRM